MKPVLETGNNRLQPHRTARTKMNEAPGALFPVPCSLLLNNILILILSIFVKVLISDSLTNLLKSYKKFIYILRIISKRLKKNILILYSNKSLPILEAEAREQYSILGRALYILKNS